ncbi:hypothetical protein GW17_00041333 [Ensete ventricosum]|nr:hypothetical protein GW17_00041333 [Ensete ventricosum]RZR81251.1 hypothetical protein BHM03_00007434 [Ensete ventricosum]
MGVQVQASAFYTEFWLNHVKAGDWIRSESKSLMEHALVVIGRFAWDMMRHLILIVYAFSYRVLYCRLDPLRD